MPHSQELSFKYGLNFMGLDYSSAQELLGRNLSKCKKEMQMNARRQRTSGLENEQSRQLENFCLQMKGETWKRFERIAREISWQIWQTDNKQQVIDRPEKKASAKGKTTLSAHNSARKKCINLAKKRKWYKEYGEVESSRSRSRKKEADFLAWLSSVWLLNYEAC